MTGTLLGAVFVASLAGSPHCAGMCGGIVTLCAGMDGGPVRRAWIVPVLYNLGRLATYAVLGTAAGMIGAAFDFGGALLGAERIMLAIAGTGLVLVGVVALLRALGVRVGCGRGPARFLQPLVNRGFQVASTRAPRRRALTIGVLTGFLPCGWLYAFLLVAAGSGSALLGALTMATFWVGTVPILLAVASGARALLGPLRTHLPFATAGILIIVGLMTAFGRIGVADRIAAAVPGPVIPVDDPAALVEQVRGLADEVPPCCRDTEPGPLPAAAPEPP